MSQDFTVIMTFRDTDNLDDVADALNEFNVTRANTAWMQGDEENQVTADVTLSGTCRRPQEFWDQALKPVLDLNSMPYPVSVEFEAFIRQPYETIYPNGDPDE